jgi:uncharacterized protein (DUF427 family)
MSKALVDPLVIRPFPGRIRVEIGGYLLADSDAVLEVRETGRAPALYFPLSSVNLGRLQASTTTTYCPRKGEASYHSIAVGSCWELEAVWSYEAPLRVAKALAGYLAFRGDAVDAFDASGNRMLGPAACTSCT